MAVLKEVLLAAAGGAIGSSMRYGITVLASTLKVSPLLGTLSCNTLGSLLIGIFISLTAGTPMYLFGAIGICGGFTTFSTFSSQTLTCFQDGNYKLGILYALGSIILCVLFTALGIYIGKLFK